MNRHRRSIARCRDRLSNYCVIFSQKHGLSYIFISHDLAVIKAMSDYVVVMKNGKIVEEGQTEDIFESPHHEYTKTLIGAAFDLD